MASPQRSYSTSACGAYSILSCEQPTNRNVATSMVSLNSISSTISYLLNVIKQLKVNYQNKLPELTHRVHIELNIFMQELVRAGRLQPLN